MKIALIGYGKMGQMIRAVAQERGHEVVCVIDSGIAQVQKTDAGVPIMGEEGFDSPSFAAADMVIEFTAPSAAEGNILRAWQHGKKVVSGTTGWDVEALKKQASKSQEKRTMLWSSNFSIGVNILFALNQKLARLMQPHPEYIPSITETHHIHKLDAPSGTAKTLAQAIGQDVKITSMREGEVPGIHTIEWDSEVDTITLSHSAKSRKGFALGAVIAAEWLLDKEGIHTMEEVMF